MTGIGIKVSAPFLNNQTGSSKLNDLKSHMLGWYDVKRQGCTNESLAENPVLEDLSDGQYVFDFNEYTGFPENVVSSRIIKGNAYIYYNVMTHDIEPFNIKVSGLTKGSILYYYRNSDGIEKNIYIYTDGLYTTPKSYYVKDSTSGISTGFTFDNTNDGVTITMLPTKHPLELKNFEFGGLSGMGGYAFTLDGIKISSSATRIDNTKVFIPARTLATSQNILFKYTEVGDSFPYYKVKITGLQDGNIIELPIGSGIVAKDGIYDIVPYTYIGSEDLRYRYVFRKGVYNDVTIEILPNFPNSLVFNGVTPEYPVNKDNSVINTNITKVIAYNKFVVTGIDTTGFIKLERIIGNAGESVHVTFPSYKVRVSGIKGRNNLQFNHYDNVNGFSSAFGVTADGTYIVPAVNYTIEPTDEDFVIQAVPFRAISQCIIPGDGDAVTVEFLPNYPAPTTKMYGVIPTITHGAKCMMMDFVPTLPINHDGYIAYYTQRQQQSGANYALMLNNSQLANIAYNVNNSNGTYINGQLNNKLKHVDLLNKRQVVSVNANEVYEMPANRGIVIAADETLTGCFPTMALNSLILFDRELTEEEMKLVMDKLMKYEDTDNIAGDLSRSTRTMALDDSDMYGEYDVYEDEQETIEAPTEFNDNTV